MSIEHKVYERYQDIPSSWNEWLGDSHPLQINDIRLCEISMLNHLKNYYVVSYQNDKPILLSYYQLLLVTPEHFNCHDKVFQQKSLNVSLRIVKPTLLVVGNLFRHDVTFFHFLDDSMSLEKQNSFFKSTFEYMLDYTKATGIFLKDIPKNYTEGILLDDTYKQMEDDVSMVMYIPPDWTSLLDYEKVLKHKYLQRYKKIIKQHDGIQIRELSEIEIKHYALEIEQLYLQVTNNQLVSMGKINQAFFINLKNQYKENYKIFGWFYEGKMVAFSSAILHNGVYDMNYIGFDYVMNQSHAVYFNILFHCLEQAIVTRSQKLVLGRTALEVKAILGCEPEYEYSFYKLRHVVVNWFYKKVSAGFKEQIGEKWKDRHPFKSTHYTSHLNLEKTSN
jgi:hypothetical protein